MGGAHKQQSFTEYDNIKNNYSQNQKEMAEISWAHNDEGGLVNMTFTVPTEGEKGQGRQWVTFLTNLCE